MKFPKVDGPGEDIADALTLSEYDRVARVALTCEPAACFDQLDRVLDVNQYLRWLALMTFVDSGDHVDEAWFYASDTAAPESLAAVRLNHGATNDGATNDAPHSVLPASWRFEMHAWDPDDSFQSCHHGGENAMPDPHGTLKCAEGDVDNVLLRAPDVYARYMDWLEWTLAIRDGSTNGDAVGEGGDGRLVRGARRRRHRVWARRAESGELDGDDVGDERPGRHTRERGVVLVAAGGAEEGAAASRRRVAGEIRDPLRDSASSQTSPRDFREPRSFRVSPRSSLELSFDASERAYDTNALPQELVLSGVRLTNRGVRPARVFDSETGASRFVVRVGFDPKVVYRGTSYVARDEEFAVACWDDSRGGNADRIDPIDAAPRCDLVSDDVSDKYVVRPAIGNGTASIRFERVGESGSSNGVLCGGCELELGTVSLHHKHWLGFEDGIVVKTRTGRARSRSTLSAATIRIRRGGRERERSRTERFAAARASSSSRRRVRP